MKKLILLFSIILSATPFFCSAWTATPTPELIYPVLLNSTTGEFVMALPDPEKEIPTEILPFVGTYPSTSTSYYIYFGSRNYYYIGDNLYQDGHINGYLASSTEQTNFWVGIQINASSTYLYQYYFPYTYSTSTGYNITNSAPCSEYHSQLECQTQRTENFTDICQWSIQSGSSSCVYATTSICGNYNQCKNCTTQTSCKANDYCEWSGGYFSFMYKGLHNAWDSTVHNSTSAEAWLDIINEPNQCYNTYLTALGTTTASSDTIPEVMYNNFSDKFPFAYYYYIKDKLILLSLNNSTTSINPLSLNIPNYIFESTTTHATTQVMTAFTITIFDKDWLLKFVPMSTWITIRELISAGFIILLSFKLLDKIKEAKVLVF